MENSVRHSLRSRWYSIWNTSVRESLVQLARGFVLSRAASVAGLLAFSVFSGPEPFASFGVYLAVATVLWVVVCGRFEQAIVFASNGEEAAALSVLAALIGLATTSIIAIATTVLVLGLVPLTGSLEATPALLLLPLSVAFRASSRIITNRATRDGAFISFAIAMQSQAFAQATVQLGLLWLGLNSLTCLIAADAAGYAAATLGAVRSSPRTVKNFTERPALSALLAAARRWQQMPAWNMPTALLSVGALSLPAVLLPIGYPASIAGQIAFTMRLFELPSNLITSICTPVLQKQLKDADHPAVVVYRSVAGLTLLGTVLFGGTALIAVALSGLLSHTRWSLLASAAASLAPFYAGLTLSGPLIDLVPGFRAERRAFPVHVLFLLAMASASALILWRVDWRVVLLAFGIAMACRGGLFAWLLRREANLRMARET
jgi:hypothetical protein